MHLGGGATDPYWSNVTLLVKADGAITNLKGNWNLEVVGSTQPSTSIKKFGTGSMYFSADGDAVRHYNAAASDLGTGALTVEFWNYITAKNGLFLTIGPWPWYLTIGYDTYGGGGFNFSMGYNNSYGYQTDYGILNQWQHWALVRGTDGYVNLYVYGILRFRSTFASTSQVYDGSASGFYIGNSHDLRYRHRGYIDEVRLTKGIARYTGNTLGTSYFTPPTTSFPTQ